MVQIEKYILFNFPYSYIENAFEFDTRIYLNIYLHLVFISDCGLCKNQPCTASRTYTQFLLLMDLLLVDLLISGLQDLYYAICRVFSASHGFCSFLKAPSI